MTLDSRTGEGQSHTGPTEKLPEIIQRNGGSFFALTAVYSLSPCMCVSVPVNYHYSNEMGRDLLN